MKKAKRILVILLTLVLALALFACNSGKPATSPTDATKTPPPASEGSPDVAPSGEERTFLPPTEITKNGFFDPNYDYFANPTIKVGYLVLQSGVLYEMGADAMREWAKRMNIEFTMFDANGDNDLYISNIRTLANQGYDGLIFDPDTTIYERIAEVANEVGIHWFPSMAPPYDSNGRLLTACAGFDHYDMGVQIVNWLLDYAAENWPDAKPEEIGCIGVDYSSSIPIHARIEAAKDRFLATYPGNDKNFFVADTVVGSMDSPTAYAQVGAIIPTQPHIKYWIIPAATDDLADGAASAAMDAGFGDTTVVACGGGPALIQQWDVGEETPWKCAVYTATMIATETHLATIYAYVAGWQTPETIWQPDWVDKSKNEKYAFYISPCFNITKDNYQRYMEWVDLYTGVDLSHYDVEVTLDDFVARDNKPPASYAG